MQQTMATRRDDFDPYESNTREYTGTSTRTTSRYLTTSETSRPSGRYAVTPRDYETLPRSKAQDMTRSAVSKTRKRKKKRRSRTLWFSLAVMLVLGAAVLIYQFIFQKQESIMSMDPTPISTQSTYLNTGDGLLYQTDGQIHFYHLTDEKKNYTYGMGASDIRMSGSESMTIVFNSASLQVVGKKEPLTFTGSVREVECGKNHIAVLRTNESNVDTVLVLTPDGEQLDQRVFPDQYVLDFGLYNVGGPEMIWIETLNCNATAPTTTVSIYDTSKANSDGGMGDITGVINVQDQLIDDIYITQSSLFAAGTNQIIRYTHDGNKEIYRTTVYGYHVSDFSSASDAPTFLLVPRGSDFHSVRMLTLSEGSAPEPVDTFLQLPAEGIAAYIMGNRLVVASREKVFTYSLKGKLQSEATFEQPVDAAIKLTDSILMLSSNGTYYLATVK